MPLCLDAHADLTLRRCRVEILELSRFRNFFSLQSRFDERPVVLHGANGSGKTNLLEALTCLTLGRGLRRARIRDLDHDPDNNPGNGPNNELGNEPNNELGNNPGNRGMGRGPNSNPNSNTGNEPNNETVPTVENEDRDRDWGEDSQESREVQGGWKVRGRLDTIDGCHDIQSTHVLLPSGRDRRRMTMDGDRAGSPLNVESLAPMLWMTPDNEALGMDPVSTRRRFFDRLVALFDLGHRARCSAFERKWREREKILGGNIAMSTTDRQSWCDSIEETLAGLAVAITAARLSLLGPLDDLCQQESSFPGARLSLSGAIEDRLNAGTALATEESLRRGWAACREHGQNRIGPHRSILSIRRSDGATHASTGQEKALVLRLLCAAASLFARRMGALPILLIDETVAHFDTSMRQGLFEHLRDLNAQVWMSGSDPDFFAFWGDQAQFFHVGQGTIRSCSPPAL